MSFLVGNIVKVRENNGYSTVAAGLVAPVSAVKNSSKGKDLFVVRVPGYGGLNFFAEELELLHSNAPGECSKEAAFRKAVELAPDALVEDQITLAEWLIKND